MATLEGLLTTLEGLLATLEGLLVTLERLFESALKHIILPEEINQLTAGFIVCCCALI